MSKFPLPLGQIVQDNLSILVTFAFSRSPLESLIESKFEGEWKYLRRTLFEISEQRAVKAAIELALFLRLLDDEERISDYLKENSGRTFGKILFRDKSEKPLRLRDVMNKIIHASSYTWDFSNEENPLLICHSKEKEKWDTAKIDIVRLSAFVGQLIA